MPTRKSSPAPGPRRGRSRTPAHPVLRLLPQTSLAGIHRLATTWGLGDWDVLIAGDGSGQGWDQPCGWASVLVDRHVGRLGGRKKFHGAMNAGTVGLAELLPYLQALSWYRGWREKHAHPRDGALTRVAIVSDSKGLVDQGNALLAGGKLPASVQANRAFWVALADFPSLGFAIRLHWVRRATFALNALCDDLAGRSRLAVSEDVVRARVAEELLLGVAPPRDPAGRELSVYDVNPDDDREHGDFDPKSAGRKARRQVPRAAG